MYSPLSGHVGRLLGFRDGIVSADSPQERVTSPVGLDPLKQQMKYQCYTQMLSKVTKMS